ncbi:SDR family NAD(P)-dependent oxidoreductase, partial [Candidatus Ulvibacter alkanivorans]|uniref:SDR family NAD(P)-dependent oxidoreductase n=1 Tax=Candidatus Ulvibacter alkanivorans TaxID=2267620 RepID=UPI000DF1B5D4
MITGGASGLGLAMALRWAKTGASICIVDRDESRKDEAIKTLQTECKLALFFKADITSDEDIQALKSFTDEKLGNLDL